MDRQKMIESARMNKHKLRLRKNSIKFKIFGAKRNMHKNKMSVHTAQTGANQHTLAQYQVLLCNVLIFIQILAIIYVRPCMRSREKVCKSDKDALPICMIILTFGQLWFFKKNILLFFQVIKVWTERYSIMSFWRILMTSSQLFL